MRLDGRTTYSWAGDVTAGLIVCTVGLFGLPPIAFTTPLRIIYILVLSGTCIALVFIRRAPRTASTVLAAFLLVHLAAFDSPSLFAGAACLIAAYATQTQLVPPWRWGFLAAIFLGGIAAMIRATDPSDDWQTRAVAAASVCAAISLAATLGALRRQRRTRYELAIERAAILEGQLGTERLLAAFEERHRIAREIHDILGHSLNAIAAQAEGARYVLESQPTRTDKALADIAHLSRTAVSDVRDVIDVLRTEDECLHAGPNRTLRDLDELVDTLRIPGKSFDLQLLGDIGTVPSRISRTAYRIVQESATNAIRHGRSPITIRVAVDADSLEVTVINPVTILGAEQHGHGLIGMAERARAHGGRFEAGPDATARRWRVHVRIPWSRS